MPARSTMTSSRPRRRSCSQSRQCVQKSRPLGPQICGSNGARLVRLYCLGRLPSLGYTKMAFRCLWHAIEVPHTPSTATRTTRPFWKLRHRLQPLRSSLRAGARPRKLVEPKHNILKPEVKYRTRMCTTLSTVSLPLEILRVILVLRRERLGLAPCRRHVGVSPGAVATAVAAAGAPSEVRLCEASTK